MFGRMILRGALIRRGPALSALVAVLVAAAVASAMLTLYVDAQSKLRKEFRSYGANVVVIGRDNQPLPENTLSKVETVLAGKGTAVPFAYVVARTANGSAIVVSGTDMQSVRRLNGWWSVSAWPSNGHEALLGIRAASLLSSNHNPFDLTFEGHTIHLDSAGTLRTGAAEDSRIYLSLGDFEAWTHLPPSTIEVAVNGTPREVSAVMEQIAKALPNADVHPVRQIVEAEGRVLAKTRATLLAAAILIILTAALCVTATLTAWVLDRRRDFAIMKALGASERMVAAFFATEAAVLGAVGAVTGFIVGIAVADWIGRANFHAGVTPRLVVFPIVIGGSIALALIAAVVPMALLRRVQPAIMLRGE